MLGLLRNVSGRHSKQCVIVVVFMAVVFFVIRYIPDLNGSGNRFVKSQQRTVSTGQHDASAGEDYQRPFVIIEHSNLEAVPAWLTRENTCPACFGIDACKVVREKLRIQLPENLTEIRKTKFYALFEKELVVVRTLVSEEMFERYDRYICGNGSTGGSGQTETCNIAPDVIRANSPAVQQESFLPKNLQSAWKIVHNSPASLPFALCATKDLIKQMTKTVDPDRDGALTIYQVAELYTSSVLNQEAMLLKFFQLLPVRMPVPRILGACGRVVVVEDYGKNLLNYLQSPWELRAELALQILELIDSFVSTDSKWAFLLRNVQLHSFFVIEDRELLVSDLSDILVIDKQMADPVQKIDYVCNEECFEKFSRILQQEQGSPEHQAYCTQAPPVGKHQMLQQVCRRVFSDSLEDRTTRSNYQDRPGLLHSPPESISDDLAATLLECIEESEVGERQEAVIEMKKTLQDSADTLNH